MANIQINEYSASIGYRNNDAQYATVALPITSQWGPALYDGVEDITDVSAANTLDYDYLHFSPDDIQKYIATYRGPIQSYKLYGDYSYQVGLTLLAKGYDVLVQRISLGTKATGDIYNTIDGKPEFVIYTLVEGAEAPTWEANTYYSVKAIVADKSATWVANTYYSRAGEGTEQSPYTYTVTTSEPQGWGVDTFYVLQGTLTTYEPDDWSTTYNSLYYTQSTIPATPVMSVEAKYRGTFGNSIRVKLTQRSSYWILAVYSENTNGGYTPLESTLFTLDMDAATDSVIYIDEIQSNFIDITSHSLTSDIIWINSRYNALEGAFDLLQVEGKSGGNTWNALSGQNWASLIDLTWDEISTGTVIDLATLKGIRGWTSEIPDSTELPANGIAISKMYNYEYIFKYAADSLNLLTDKFTYNPYVITLPSWDDLLIFDELKIDIPVSDISPLTKVLLTAAYMSRCACSYIATPYSLAKSEIDAYLKAFDAFQTVISAQFDGENVDREGLFLTHSALFAPYGEYKLVGETKYHMISASILALILQRSMILNQSQQFFWLLPSSRKTNTSTQPETVRSLQYKISKTELDSWQNFDEGISFNVIANIPTIGLTVWGNSTLFNNPPATYQALHSLSTRHLIDALKDLSYTCGISITYQYNNSQAYSAFYAGMTPTLDTMVNCGAITGYKIEMSKDLANVDQVDYNSVLGKVYLTIEGVINNITVDLIALPSDFDLTTV